MCGGWYTTRRPRRWVGFPLVLFGTPNTSKSIIGSIRGRITCQTKISGQTDSRSIEDVKVISPSLSGSAATPHPQTPLRVHTNLCISFLVGMCKLQTDRAQSPPGWSPDVIQDHKPVSKRRRPPGQRFLLGKLFSHVEGSYVT